MPMDSTEAALAKAARPLKSSRDLDPLIEKIAHARVVMLGEASHGTHEFYEWRSRISQELIRHHGFRFIAVEGDWPPCQELNRYLHSDLNIKDAREALLHFRRWPTWMWANNETAELAEWIRRHNQKLQPEIEVGFYGLDVYSLFESIDETLAQVRKIDPVLAERVKVQYDCLDPFRRDERAYAKSLFHFPAGCEMQVLEALKSLLQIRLDKPSAHAERLFDAQQNARIVKNAEAYYRAMVLGEDDSWNIRDQHMIETLETLLRYHGRDSKAIVWAHNTHIGDYRATNMIQAGQVNIGGLARKIWGPEQVALVGFGTYEGHVIASHAWDGAVDSMPVPPGIPGSYEAHFHAVSERINADSFYVWLQDKEEQQELSAVHGHRAIGVVYHPAHERYGNYVPTSLARRYDGFIFVDKTTALRPLRQTFERREFPETYPQGF